MNNKYLCLKFKEVKSALSIEQLFLAMSDNVGLKNLSCLLSAESFGDKSRWSFFAADPLYIFKYKKGRGTLASESDVEDFRGNPFDILDEIQGRFSCSSVFAEKQAPFPFKGGWLGAFSYELGYYIEDIKAEFSDDFAMPELYLAFYESFLVYDNSEKSWYCAGLQRGGEDERCVDERLGKISALLEVNSGHEKADIEIDENNIVRDFSRSEYEGIVRQAVEYIYAGDIFQVNLSQRFSAAGDFDSAEIMSALMQKNPAPFSAYLEFDGKAVISSSPERFLLLSGRKLETRPIKGTRPRGSDAESDKRFKEELLASEKDAAELNMITDLLRNDLGRVCEYGSVKVIESRLLEEYKTVFHTVSIIKGLLRDGTNAGELLKAAFPGGSITGAPKVRAMQIVAELERCRRSFYTGAVGYIGVDGDIDLNIAIRTILYDGSKLTFQAGGGIVAESDPAMEYEETLHKAEGMFRALGRR
ncbi:MAG: anthranilate synthase component I family protein [Planctomycetota bacterium]|jgi:para-aminobenzoate synthetase component 1